MSSGISIPLDALLQFLRPLFSYILKVLDKTDQENIPKPLASGKFSGSLKPKCDLIIQMFNCFYYCILKTRSSKTWHIFQTSTVSETFVKSTNKKYTLL